MENKLLLIGHYKGRPVAVNDEGQTFIWNEVAMDGFFDSGFFKTIEKAFDPESTVGQFLVPALNTYTQNLVGGSSSSDNYSSGIPSISNSWGTSSLPQFNSSNIPGFTPTQPQVIVVSGSQQSNPENQKDDTMLWVLGSITAITVVIALAVKKRSGAKQETRVK